MTDQPSTPEPGAPGPNAGGVPPTPPPPPGGATPPPPPPPGGYGAPPPPPPPGGYGAPPPPPPGYGAPQPAGGSSNVDVGAAFNWAIQKFGKYAAILIGLAAVVFVIRLVGNFFTAWLTDRLIGTCNPTVVIGENGVITTGSCAASFTTTIIAGLISALVFGILAWIATIGVYRAALKTTLGEIPGFHHLTSTENLAKYIWVAIVYGFASAAGLILCILPGIVVIFLFQFAPFYALDKGQGVGQAFGNSYRAVTANFVPVLLAALVNIVASFVGSILWGVLTLVTLPFAALFTAHIYRQVNSEAVAP